MSELQSLYRSDRTQKELEKLSDKWFVKRLSGELVGYSAYFDSRESANAQAFYLADNGICPKVCQVIWYKGKLCV